MTTDQLSQEPPGGGAAWRSQVTPTSTHYWVRKRREVARLLSSHVALAPRAQIVDFGAGGGADAAMLMALYPGRPILTLELNGEAREKLRERFAGNPDVTVQEADLRAALPLADASVDLGHSSETLEHLPDPAVFLNEASRVIKPGGYLVATTPNEPNVFQRTYWRQRLRPGGAGSGATPSRSPAGKRQDLDLFGHISLRTVDEWDKSIGEAGFELVDFGRGSIAYGGGPRFQGGARLAGFFAAEALIDLAPRRLARRLSGQYIGLFRRR